MRKFETGNDVRQIISCSEGGRAFRLLKKREENSQRTVKEMSNIENETKKRKFSGIDQKFGASRADAIEEEFKTATVGLVSAEEFKRKRQEIDDKIQGSMRRDGGKEKLSMKRKVSASKLSFGQDESEQDSEGSEGSEVGSDSEPAAKRGFGKNPAVDTSFLYDADRESELQRQKDALIAEYLKEQAARKKEKLEVTYSYWDGSGHRRSCVVEKGFSIGQFVAKSKGELEKTDFPELRTVSLDNLMYVKEDLILPHNITFYELIKDRARGKSGPLFNFDVHEDIRMANDSRIEKDESHAGKLVDRKWYERNKHIFPACRWEMYSKDKTFDSYTVHGGDIQNKS